MDEEHITDSGNDQGLVWTRGESLNDTGREQHVISGRNFSESISNYREEGSDDENRPFTISAGQSTVERSSSQRNISFGSTLCNRQPTDCNQR